MSERVVIAKDVAEELGMSPDYFRRWRHTPEADRFRRVVHQPMKNKYSRRGLDNFIESDGV